MKTYYILNGYAKHNFRNELEHVLVICCQNWRSIRFAMRVYKKKYTGITKFTTTKIHHNNKIPYNYFRNRNQYNKYTNLSRPRTM